MSARLNIICCGGPYDGRTCKYPGPLPKTIVIADNRLHYHEYEQRTYCDSVPGRVWVYQWERSYRIPLHPQAPARLGARS